MCVLCVSSGSTVRPRTFRCVAMGSAWLFILRSSFKLFCLDLVLSRQKLCVFLVLDCTRACVCRRKEEGSSPVSLQLLRGGIWTCMMYPCLCLCWVLGWGLY